MFLSVLLLFSTAQELDKERVIARRPRLDVQAITKRNAKEISGLETLLKFFISGLDFDEIDYIFNLEQGTTKDIFMVANEDFQHSKSSVKFQDIWDDLKDKMETLPLSKLIEESKRLLPLKTNKVAEYLSNEEFGSIDLKSKVDDIKDVLNIVLNHWSPFSSFIKVLNLNADKIHSLIQKVYDDVERVTILDVCETFDMDKSLAFETMDVYFKALSDNSYTLGNAYDFFSFDKTLINEHADLWNQIYKAQKCSGQSISSLVLKMVQVVFDLNMNSVIYIWNLIKSTIQPLVNVVDIINAPLTQRFNYLIDGISNVLKEIQDLPSDTVEILNGMSSEAAKFNGEGFEIRTLLQNYVGKQAADIIVEELVNFADGKYTIGDTLRSIGSRLPSNSPGQLLIVIANVGANLQKDAKFKDFLESLNIVKDAESIYESIRPILLDLSNRNLDLRNYQFLDQDIANIIVENIQRISEAIANLDKLSDIIPDEVITVIRALHEALTTSLPDVLERELGFPGDFFEGVASVFKILDDVLNTAETITSKFKIFPSFSTVVNRISGITGILSNPDFTLVDIIHEITGIDISVITKVLNVVLNVDETIDNMVSVFTENNNYIDLSATFKQLSSLKVYSFHNIIDCIKIPANTPSTNFLLNIKYFEGNLTASHDSITTDSLTMKQVAQMIGYDFTFIGDYFAESSGSSVSEYSLRSIISNNGGSDYMSGFADVAHGIKNNKLKAETIDSFAQTFATPQTPVPEEKGSSKTVAIVISVIAVVIAIIAGTCCFYFLYWRPRHPKEGNSDAPVQNVLLI